MQPSHPLPFEQWAQQLSQARQAHGLNVSELSRELLLSPAQLRGLESGSMAAFHGTGYYLRAIEKYAQHLDVTLEPAVQALELTDSQLALQRYKTAAPAKHLARHQANLQTADKIPLPSTRTRIGVLLVCGVLALVGIGVWLALAEGWPGLTTDEDTPATIVDPNSLTKRLATAADEAKLKPSDLSAVAAAASAPNSNGAAQGTMDQADASGTQPDAATLPSDSVTTPAADQPSTADPSASEKAQDSQKAQPQPTPDEIKATFNADCWVEVRYLDGTIKQAVYKPGQTLEVPSAEVKRLTFGNAQAVSASRQGKPLDLKTFTKGRSNIARIYESNLR